MPFTAVIDRAFEEVCLIAAEANTDGDYAFSEALPAGFGDCALLEVFITVNSIATLVAGSELMGPSAQLLDVNGNAQDVGFCSRWIRRSATGLHAHLAPDQVQFWRESDVLRVTFPEMDSNATPTGDTTVYAKVRRLRPMIDRTPEETHFFLTS